MAYSFKGAISFGLVYIPITLHTCIKSKDFGFNMIDKKNLSRIKYIKVSENDEKKVVKNSEIVKGYEYEDGKYVIFDNNDFDKLKSKKDKNINISQFINLEEIDPIFYDKAYYVVPINANRAYDLLLTAMEDEKKAAVATLIMNYKQSPCLIRPYNGKMVLNTLFYYDQLMAYPKEIDNSAVDTKELKLAKNLIDSMTKKIKFKDIKDEYSKKLQDAINRKINGKEIVKTKEKSEKTNIVDLMDALQQSLISSKSTKSSAKKYS